MAFLNIQDLHNPSKVIAILHNNGTRYEANPETQGFQETKGRYELWEKFPDGRLLEVCSWNKKSTLSIFTK